MARTENIQLESGLSKAEVMRELLKRFTPQMVIDFNYDGQTGIVTVTLRTADDLPDPTDDLLDFDVDMQTIRSLVEKQVAALEAKKRELDAHEQAVTARENALAPRTGVVASVRNFFGGGTPTGGGDA